jgi:hypothetical protein
MLISEPDRDGRSVRARVLYACGRNPPAPSEYTAGTAPEPLWTLWKSEKTRKAEWRIASLGCPVRDLVTVLEYKIKSFHRSWLIYNRATSTNSRRVFPFFITKARQITLTNK